MQTFLPYPEMTKSLVCLDYRRLGKQRVEAKQILTALQKGSGAWYNHPATQMWKGYEETLKLYHNLAIKEWIARGYKNTMPLFNVHISDCKAPYWFGDSAFHASHRSNLLRKDPAFYSQYNWSEPDNLEYIWPTKTKIVQENLPSININSII